MNLGYSMSDCMTHFGASLSNLLSSLFFSFFLSQLKKDKIPLNSSEKIEFMSRINFFALILFIHFIEN